MNLIYRVVFNALTGTWQAVSEIARGRSKSSRSNSGIALSALCGLWLGFAALPAQAVCSVASLTVTCSGAYDPLAPSYTNDSSNLIVTLTTGSSVGTLLGLGGTSLALTGSNITLKNSGTISPTLLGQQNSQSTAVLVGKTGSASTFTINNMSSGTFSGTGALLGSNLSNLTGMALDVRNSVGGWTTISNAGTINSHALASLTLIPADTPVVAVTGGSTVKMTNTGTIIGRVAFESSSTGNTFTNAGSITGSVSLGAGGGDNEFVAISGSSISKGSGSGIHLPVTSNPKLSFAAAGIVDGGGNATNNRLTLQNSANGPGSGSSGLVTTVDLGQFINFQRLTVNSGTWNLLGAWTGSGAATLNDGLVNFNNARSFGAGLFTANGGSIAASGVGLTLGNNFNLVGNLSLAGSNVFGLSGVLSGKGGLTVNNTGVVTLSGANLFSGGVNLNAGGLVLGNSSALGSGTLTVGGASMLDNSLGLSLKNDIVLNQTLTVRGSYALTLDGAINGTGGLTKNGAATLTLNSNNTYSGGTTLNAGTLVVGHNNALGTGAVTVAGAATLDSSRALTLANAINLGAGLTLGGSNDLTLGGVISGAGSLTKDSSGTLTLTEVNTLSGNTTVNAGLLKVDGTLSSSNVQVNATASLGGAGNLLGAVDIASGAYLQGQSGQILSTGHLTLRSGTSVEVALGSPLTGGAALFNVNGNLTLDGTLNVTDIGGFGTGVYRLFDYSGSLVDNGLVFGVLPGGVVLGDLQLQTSIGNQINLVVGGASNVLFWDGSQSVANGTIKGGTGTWSATDTNWTDAYGTMNTSWNGQFAIFQGTSGEVTVVGTHTATGLQFVTSGYRLIGSGGLNMVNGSNGAFDVLVDPGATATIDVGLSGSGTLAKVGSGTLVLNGANSYTGGTHVNAGMLTVNGSVAGNVAVASGATLAGTGRVGTTTVSGATIAPGSASTPYGTLTVVGNLNMDGGSILRVAVDPIANQAGKLSVDGTAALNGTLQVDGQSLNFNGADRTYTVVSAQSVTGQFANVAANFAFLNATADYADNTKVDLKLTRKTVTPPVNPPVTPPVIEPPVVEPPVIEPPVVEPPVTPPVIEPPVTPPEVTPTPRPITFADLAQTGNQRVVAQALEGMPTSSALHNFVLGLPNGAPPAVFAQLSGDSHAGVQGSLPSLSGHTSHTSLKRLHNNLTAGLRAGAPIAQSDGPLPASAWPTSKALPAWVEVVGHRQTLDGNSNAPGVKQNVYGLFLGADEEVDSSGWRVGGSLGYTNADAEVKSRDASADISSYSASVYTGKGFSHGINRINVMGGLAYTHHRIDSQRSVASLGQNLKADYTANTLQLFGEVGYAMGQYSKQGVEPFAGINISQQRVGSFQENGGFAALRSSSSNDTSTSTTLGVRAHSDFKLAGKDARIKGTVGWRHAWGDVKQTATMAFEGSNSFSVTGAPLARNTALLGLQAEVELSRHAALELGYQGEYGSGTRDHAVNVKMRWAY